MSAPTTLLEALRWALSRVGRPLDVDEEGVFKACHELLEFEQRREAYEPDDMSSVKVIDECDLEDMRDRFAGRAMQAILTTHLGRDVDLVAHDAYAQADAHDPREVLMMSRRLSAERVLELKVAAQTMKTELGIKQSAALAEVAKREGFRSWEELISLAGGALHVREVRLGLPPTQEQVRRAERKAERRERYGARPRHIPCSGPCANDPSACPVPTACQRPEHDTQARHVRGRVRLAALCWVVAAAMVIGLAALVRAALTAGAS